MNNQGFTLIEMIIYIAIIGIVLFGFMSYGVSVSGVRNKSASAAIVQANGRVALEMLTKKIHEASAVISPVSGASANQLVLDMPGTNPNLTFVVSNGVLTMTETGLSTTTLTDVKTSVSNLQFINLSYSGERANIGIILTIESAPGATDVHYQFAKTYQTAVSTRP